jgi:hypothetical protein
LIESIHARRFHFVAECLLQGARALIVPGAYYIYVNFVSPTTRKRSPHSRRKVTDSYGLTVRGCNELLQNYGSTMDSDMRRTLLCRRRILERAVTYQDAHEALRRRQLFKATRLVIAQLFIFVLIGNLVMGMLAANARAFLYLPNARRHGKAVLPGDLGLYH